MGELFGSTDVVHTTNESPQRLETMQIVDGWCSATFTWEKSDDETLVREPGPAIDFVPLRRRNLLRSAVA